MKKFFLSLLILTPALLNANNYIELNNTNDFDSLINTSDYKGVVVDFYATWCGPCKLLAPFIQKLAQQNPSILFVKVESALRSLHNRFGIRSIPTVAFFKNGKEVKRIIGLNKNSIKVAMNSL